MEKQFKKFYIQNMVREINKEIKREEKEIFSFIKLYVKAMKIIEKIVEEKKVKLKEKLTEKFVVDYGKFICVNGNSEYLISLYRDVLQRIRSIHFNKKIIFI